LRNACRTCEARARRVCDLVRDVRKFWNGGAGNGQGRSVNQREQVRYALVIDNSAYQYIGVLPNPVNDAREMAEALKRIDVQVEVVIDANRETMIGALNKLSLATEFADLAIVHYSGHGIEISGKNYLLPTGVQLNQPSDADSQAVAFEQVYAAIGRAPGVKLILLDACRDNPLPGRLGLPPRRGLASPSPPRDTLVAYAKARRGCGGWSTWENKPVHRRPCEEH
jgi:uncharacterized caspase-like protein